MHLAAPYFIHVWYDDVIRIYNGRVRSRHHGLRVYHTAVPRRVYPPAAAFTPHDGFYVLLISVTCAVVIGNGYAYYRAGDDAYAVVREQHTAMRACRVIGYHLQHATPTIYAGTYGL
ncbi:hypothetical protein NPIL_17711 [Nephila pilipes]|uniref:Uncharacterized protein n=1 Tax=Nephila pilipes TaxID=299642 RepID=A0A8X6QVR2_NEPPI|nr:hypothetical protein NPIL_17711 [Nephila pilipes]